MPSPTTPAVSLISIHFLTAIETPPIDTTLLDNAPKDMIKLRRFDIDCA